MSDTEELYKSFVGTEALATLQKRFQPKLFAGRWEQVMTSYSTRFMGTGIDYTSVHAIYKLLPNGAVDVNNYANDANMKPVSIHGISEKRHILETCRTVKFDNLPVEGDYWIIYANKRCDAIIVAASLIARLPMLDPFLVAGNVGLYVLTKNRSNFWANDVDEIMSVLRKYGFNQFYNAPIVSV